MGRVRFIFALAVCPKPKRLENDRSLEQLLYLQLDKPYGWFLRSSKWDVLVRFIFAFAVCPKPKRLENDSFAFGEPYDWFLRSSFWGVFVRFIFAVCPKLKRPAVWNTYVFAVG